MMIRALARLYGLPITSYEAGRLWQTIIKSLGSLLLGEVASMMMLGWAKTGAIISSLWENPSGFTMVASTVLTQGAIAAYGSYIVGKSTQVYLENGCTWGNYGLDTVIGEIIAQSPPDAIISRLRG